MSNGTEAFQQAMRRGHNLAWDRRYEQALGEYRVALAECPDDVMALTSMGLTLYELRRMPEALQVYQAAARHNPNDPNLLERVANIQERLGQHEEAARTYVAVAESYLRLRNVDRAVEYWQQSIRLSPNLLGAHRRLALVYERQGKTRPAIRELLAIARISLSRREIDKAIEACEQALKLDPIHPDVITVRDLLRQGDVITAHVVLEKDKDNGVEAYPAAATVPEAQAGGPAESTQDQDRSALDLDGLTDSPTLRIGPAKTAQHMAMTMLAEEVFEQTQEGFEAFSVGPVISQAMEQQLAGNIPQAIKLFEQALHSGMTSPAARFNLGLLYQQIGWLDQAAEQLRQTTVDPVFRLGSLFALAEVDQARGQIDELVAHLTEAIQAADISAVPAERVEKLAEAYQSTTMLFKTLDGAQAAERFAGAVFELLRTSDWEDRVRQARERIDSLSDAEMNVTLVEMYCIPTAQEVMELLDLTQQYLAQGLVQAAIEDCYRAIELAPGYLPTHVRLAQLLLAESRIDESATKYAMIARTAEIRGDNRRAIHMYANVTRISPLDQDMRSRLIHLLLTRSDYDQAIEQMLALADGYYQLARLDDARRVYRETLKLAPKGSLSRGWAPHILRCMGNMCMQTLDWREALVIYEQLRKLVPGDEPTRRSLIELYYKVGQPAKAASEVDALGRLLTSQGRLTEYLHWLDDWVRQRPAEMSLRSRFAQALRDAGRTAEAVVQLDTLGEMQIDAGLREEASKTIQTILEYSPANADRYRQALRRLGT